MIIWVDAQISPYISDWITATFKIESYPIRRLGLRDAADVEIFQSAREASAIVMTKDSDFCDLVLRLGPPPKILWITCGNTSNEKLQGILLSTLSNALTLLEAGEPLVEISGK